MDITHCAIIGSRQQFWNRQIGKNNESGICQYCKRNQINKNNFKYGVLKTESQKNITLDNIVLICNDCDKSEYSDLFHVIAPERQNLADIYLDNIDEGCDVPNENGVIYIDSASFVPDEGYSIY